MLRKYFLKLAAIGVVLLTAGCAPSVGDSCETSSECPAGAICDVTAPGGYCTIDGCDSMSCPDGSVCVEFDEEESFCLEYCESTNECRRDYTCRTDVGPAGFCYVTR